MNRTAGQILYGALFVVIIPVLLVLWTIRTESAVTLSSIDSLPIGVAIALLGLLLMILGMVALWKLGGGLPMNAFPPPRYVASGIYGWISHPIYTGFVLVCGGCSIATGSASGLWLTTPAVALACTALVMGYELPDMQRRFGDQARPLRWLPSDELTRPSLHERLRCVLTVLIPWYVCYEAVVGLGVPSDAVVAYLPFEQHWPVFRWSEILYATVYPAVVITPFVVRTRSALRRFSIQALISMAIVFPLFLTLPLIASPRILAASSSLDRWLSFDRSLDSAVGTFPSYHVIWAFLVVSAMADSARWRKYLWHGWAVFVSISCVTTGMHALLDVVFGFLLALALRRWERLWERLRRITEWTANSWHEWRVGPVRVINHGVYAAAAAFFGMLIIDVLLGPGAHGVSLAIFVFGIVGAALWAQWVEGSPILLRPLGFYGGLMGAILGAVLASAWNGAGTWSVLAALSVAGPWIQGIGRLRCLVQGCCHGRETCPRIGIRYLHPRSRVFRIPALSGVPIHATPLYSVLWNIVVGLAVGRLYILGVSATMIGGIYLLLSGLGRFVEEAYRGEPQTPVVAGLRLYQWIAIATVVAGATVTTISAGPPPLPYRFEVSSLAIASVCALLAWVVAGVDLPASNRRFSRLA